ncbi:5-formyltetrahydrofolate cyclo-ligase [Irregularibacter muris]|uniref:5-formyltetrahydrofolate cyclo-ligase n=1 Tax=Irregularibacter muris TaxID=1796619 RepID=A0AAE3HEL9_9FIRM|nr:5-formyltetrahydrofolate cyclo-ligase [Irregularibacter muris]MCR1899082.1 5-formyltetrahydrofolate cyclo-ligase [Irregularibacter muris]
MNKSDIRKEIHIKINALSPQEIQEKSERMFEKLYSLPIYKNSTTIMTYVSIRNEVDTHVFIKESIHRGKNIIVPMCKPDTKELILSKLLDLDLDLERGFYGLLEPKANCIRPVEAKNLDMIVVPGLAFTEKGQRLGQGAGYYDRFLSSLSEHVPTIAPTFELQLVDALPTDSHDVPVDYILTENRLISCAEKK